MPREKNTAARIIVPIIAILLGALLAYSVWQSSAPSPRPAPTEESAEQADASGADEDAPDLATPTETETADAAGAQGEPAPTQAPSERVAAGDEAAAPTGNEAAAPPIDASLEGLRVRLVPAPSEPLAPIGGVDEGADARALVTFTPVGAGVASITLRDYYETLRKQDHYEIQSRRLVGGVTVASLAARGVVINGQTVGLYASGEADRWIWRPIGPGAFEATIVDADGAPVARITRRFMLGPDSFDILIDQRLENLTSAPLEVRWIQYGPVDLPEDETLYGGDKRRVTFGHLLPPERDPSRQIVQKEASKARGTTIDKPLDEAGRVWPLDDAQPGEDLVWAAMTNRYFAFAVHTPAPESPGAPFEKRLRLADRVFRTTLAGQPGAGVMDTTLLLELHSEPLTAQPGETLDLSIAAYAGPLWRKTLGEEPYTGLGLQQLVVYNFGGMCAWCTFQPLAKALLWILGAAHNYLVFDWALAIMLLVVIVRTILHGRGAQLPGVRLGAGDHAAGGDRAHDPASGDEEEPDRAAAVQQADAVAGAEAEEAAGEVQGRPQAPTAGDGAPHARGGGLLHRRPGLPADVPAEPGLDRAVRDAVLRLRPAPRGRVLRRFPGDQRRELGVPGGPLGAGPVHRLRVGPEPAAGRRDQCDQCAAAAAGRGLLHPAEVPDAPAQRVDDAGAGDAAEDHAGDDGRDVPGDHVQRAERAEHLLHHELRAGHSREPLHPGPHRPALGILESRYIRAHIDQMDLQPKKPAGGPGKKRVRNEAPANPFQKQRDKAPKYKPRGKKR